jgi:hypothetical protein
VKVVRFDEAVDVLVEARRMKKERAIEKRMEKKYKEPAERERAVEEKLRRKPVGERLPSKIGTKITKDHKNYELMFDMFLGIRVAVSATCARPAPDRLPASQFVEVRDYLFPSRGSTYTPAHKMRDFKFRDYAPKVFRKLRNLFGVDSSDYIVSLTGDYVLSEIGSPGKSSSFFYYSYDTRFVLKTISKEECLFLRDILIQYYKHVQANPNTLISRFFGLHRVKPHKKDVRYFVVMDNVFGSLDIDERFDLKGSTFGRLDTSGKPDAVLKDLNWTQGRRRLLVGPTMRARLLEQLRIDAKFLQSQNIMDYSLLVGIHTEDDETAADPADGAGSGAPSTTVSPTPSAASSVRSSPAVQRRGKFAAVLRASSERRNASSSPVHDAASSEGGSNDGSARHSMRRDGSSEDLRIPSHERKRPDIAAVILPRQGDLPTGLGLRGAYADLAEDDELSGSDYYVDEAIEEERRLEAELTALEMERDESGTDSVAKERQKDLTRQIKAARLQALRAGKAKRAIVERKRKEARRTARKERLALKAQLRAEEQQQRDGGAVAEEMEAGDEKGDHFSDVSDDEESIEHVQSNPSAVMSPVPKSPFKARQGGFRATSVNDEPLDVLYFIGIIDILQPYTVRKVGEHLLKSMVHPADASTISCVPPDKYAKRFLRFAEDEILATADASSLEAMGSDGEEAAARMAAAVAAGRTPSKRGSRIGARDAAAADAARTPQLVVAVDNDTMGTDDPLAADAVSVSIAAAVGVAVDDEEQEQEQEQEAEAEEDVSASPSRKGSSKGSKGKKKRGSSKKHGKK